MKGNMNIYYDEEGDFLEITTGDIANCFFDNIGNDVFEIKDKLTKEIKGVSIFNFKKRTQSLEPINVSLPFKFEFVS